MQQLAFVPPPASPVRQQYLALKRQHPDAILFFQLGDFFETFEEDAQAVAGACDLVLTSRELGRGERVPMAGVPVHAAEVYIARLVERGFHVAICQQMEDAATVRGSSIVRREVTRVITPGTLTDLSLLAGERPNYLAAIVVDRRATGIAYAEVSTGEFACSELRGGDHSDLARAELWRLHPAECLLADAQAGADLLPSMSATTVDNDLFSLSAETLLCQHFGVASLGALGLGESPLAARAAAAILRYVARTSSRSPSAIESLRVYDAHGFMILDPATRDHLEIMRGAGLRRTGSLLYALDRTGTSMGARLLASWLGHPLLDSAAISARHDRVEAFVNRPTTRLEVQAVLARLPDLERLAGRALQRLLTPREALAMAQAVEGAGEVRQAVTSADVEALLPLRDRLADLSPMAQRINTTLVDEPPSAFGEGVIRAGVVAELDDLRTHSTDGRRWLLELEQRERSRSGVKNLKVGYNRVFGYYLEVPAAALSQALDYYRQQETGAKTVAELLERLGYQRRQTLAAAERFVTGDLRDHEAQQARATTRMAELERAAFEELCGALSDDLKYVMQTAQALAEIDVFASLAQVADEQRYVRPELVEEPITEIVGGRHPVVEQVLGWSAYIPGDIRLQGRPAPEGISDHPVSPSSSKAPSEERDEQQPPQVAVLTGPNMAGKTTYGRMALLLTLLGQCGSFVPAERAKLGMVDRVFLRSGAGDDIAGGQSTFMVEMTETAAILRSATPRSLAFFDEVGRGTSTYDGMALARAIVEFLARPGQGCRTIFSTHYHELAEIEDERPTVRNLQMEVRETADQVAFTYRVIEGAADRSYGVHVARLAGLPPTVVARAAQVLAALEAGASERGTPGRPHSVPPAPSLPDLVLKLADLDVERMTPIEALHRLDEVRREAAILAEQVPGLAPLNGETPMTATE